MTPPLPELSNRTLEGVSSKAEVEAVVEAVVEAACPMPESWLGGWSSDTSCSCRFLSLTSSTRVFIGVLKGDTWDCFWGRDLWYAFSVVGLSRLEPLDVLADLAGDSLGLGAVLVVGLPRRVSPVLEGGMASAEPERPWKGG